MGRILDELSDNEHYTASFKNRTMQVEQGNLEDGRDYMFIKALVKNCVCYDCLV